MTTYICDKCNFSIKRDHNPGKCPYCGKGKLTKKPSAQDMLNQTIEETEEFQ